MLPSDLSQTVNVCLLLMYAFFFLSEYLFPDYLKNNNVFIYRINKHCSLENSFGTEWRVQPQMLLT